MNTATLTSTSTVASSGNLSLAEDLLSKLHHSATLGRHRATVNDGLRMRHIVAARLAESTRLQNRARWSQHNADACWYAGKLRAARQFDAQAARERDLAAWLTAEADALVRA